MIGRIASVFRHSALAAGLAVSAIALSVATAQAQPKGSVIVATSILSQNADPTSLVSTADYMIAELIYDGLINLTEKGKVPGLAESWVISPDGKQIDAD